MKNVTKNFLVIFLSLFTIFETSVALFASELYDFSEQEKPYDPYYDPYVIGKTMLKDQQTTLLHDNSVDKFIFSADGCIFNNDEYDFEFDCPVQGSTSVFVPARGINRPTNNINWYMINTLRGNIWIPRFMAFSDENLQYYPYYFDEAKGCYILAKDTYGNILALNEVNYVYFNINKHAFCYSKFFSIPPVTFQ